MNRDAIIDRLTNSQAQRAISQVRSIFKELPHLPSQIREILAQIVPWFAIVGAVLGVLSGLQYILAGIGIRPMSVEVSSDIYWFVIGVIDVISAYIAFLSFPLLKERAYSGWMLLFWNSVLAIIMYLLSLLVGLGNILGMVLSAALSFYLVFEMESLYTATGKLAQATTQATETMQDTVKNAKKEIKKGAAKVTSAAKKRAKRS